MSKRLLAVLAAVVALGWGTPALMADHWDKDTNTSTETSTSMTTISVGNTVTGTNTAPMVTAMSALRDGVAARKPVGEIADYLPAKPRSTAAGLTSTRGVPTTITKTMQGGSSFCARSLRFTVA